MLRQRKERGYEPMKRRWRTVQIYTLLLSLVALGGCASSVPELIRKAPAENPSLKAVQAQPQLYQAARVRWGGTIARVENRAKSTQLEVVARELYGDGEPKPGDASSGRFIAEVPAFLDPAIYAKGRRITVVGTIVGSEERKIGQMPYRYPRVKVEAFYLWPELKEGCVNCDPFFYSPWYPYGYPYPYPYRYPYPPPR